jgi:hypothetical protein
MAEWDKSEFTERMLLCPLLPFASQAIFYLLLFLAEKRINLGLLFLQGLF